MSEGEKLYEVEFEVEALPIDTDDGLKGYTLERAKLEMGLQHNVAFSERSVKGLYMLYEGTTGPYHIKRMGGVAVTMERNEAAINRFRVTECFTPASAEAIMEFAEDEHKRCQARRLRLRANNLDGGA